NRVEVDLAAIRHNVRELRRLIGPERKLFATLKANAYGFGLEAVAPVVLAAGADAISLAEPRDALRLREGGVTAPILLYGGCLIDAAAVDAACRHGLAMTVHDGSSLAGCLDHADRPLDVFVKVNVGLERLGLEPEAVPDAARRIVGHGKLRFGGLYTHLTMSGEGADLGYLRWQFDRFVAVADALHAQGTPAPVRLAASSAALRETSEMCLNAIDPGAMLFNLNPPDPGKVDLHLRPALSRIVSRLVAVRDLARPGRTEQAPFPVRAGMRVGVIPIGRRDGFPGLHAGAVLVRGRRAPLLGAPSLEHSRVDLSDVPDAVPGDEVVIVGFQDDDQIPLAEVMRFQKYGRPSDLAMNLSPWLPRRYLDTDR
ncbi:MAG: alanine racemase, partial [Acetobacterales bacterium]